MAATPEQTIIPTVYTLSSSAAFRILWALEEIADSGREIKYNVIQISRRSGPPYKQLKEQFPIGKSPIVTLETVDGSPPPTVQLKPGVLSEARAILRYIADTFSNGIWEPDAEDKGRDTFFLEFGSSTLTNKVDFVLLTEVLPQMLPFGPRQLAQLVMAPLSYYFKNDHKDIFQLLEDSLSDERPWFAGKKLGLSDLNIIFGMDMAVHRGYFDPAKYPKVAKWHKTVIERPAYKRSLEKGGKYNLAKFL